MNFSPSFRDESDILVKIIQSRVVDVTEDVRLGEQTEVPEKTVYSDLAFLGTWRSLNRGRKFPEGLPYSSNHLNDLSLGASLLHGYTQDLCDKAVKEAKQWLDKKKLESASKSERDFGPCTLNTDVSQYLSSPLLCLFEKESSLIKKSLSSTLSCSGALLLFLLSDTFLYNYKRLLFVYQCDSGLLR